ncbi:oligosaccharide biosynthesis protein Alg14 like-domain-containing protein [Xylaria arbuscula]|nr:oligosaccharide biosynthesis protein Alg14 like-domain-containing protein [Xylaria arbuscula]
MGRDTQDIKSLAHPSPTQDSSPTLPHTSIPSQPPHMPINPSSNHQDPSTLHHIQSNHQNPSTPQNQSNEEDLFTMNTNRDQAVQTAIGSFVVDGVKNGICLVAILGTIVIAVNSFVKFMTKPDAEGSTILLTLLVVIITGVCFFLYRAVGGTVRGISTHYVLIICGSGGHTAEMIQMVERSIRSEKSSHRRWAVGKDDGQSYEKILAFEQRLLDRFSRYNLDSGTFDVMRFGRARYVHQSWLTTPFTAILSLLDIFSILVTSPRQKITPALPYPGVIVTNGPGTGFLFLLIARAFRLLRLTPAGHMRTIYIESWARVKSLSLTGKLIRSSKLADLFIVQSRYLVDETNVLAQNLIGMPQAVPVPVYADD